MKLKTSIIPIFWFFLITFHSVSAQTCGYFKLNSTYDLNRRLVLSSLASNVTTHNGFYSSSIGQNPNRIFIIGMCIPGTTPEKCSDCVKGSTDGLLRSCPNPLGYVWIDCCMVRYSNYSFSKSLVMEPSLPVSDPKAIDVDLTVFDRIWDELMVRTITAASNGSSSFGHKYYAAKVASLTTSQTIYAMMQCTPDVSSGDCEFCLKRTVGDYKSCCRGNSGGAFVRPFCFIRWDLYPFAGAFNNITSSPPPQSSQDPQESQSTRFLGGYSGDCSLGLIALKRRQSYKSLKLGTNDDITKPQSLQIDFKTIEAATDKFSGNNKVGQGGFGEVYKGTLPNGTEVAVKRLSKNSGQGTQEFKNEVVLVAKLQHRNLVRLLGICVEGNEQILVYEFVPNKSLDNFFYDQTKRRQLDWTRRYNIIGGLARGILSLHQDSRLTIIHRDLKASNILLDDDMNPKIADFGMARIFGMDQTGANTSKIDGTFGYMAPEYAMHGQFSMKSDVYSFGVLVLEIISGKMNSSFNQTDGSAGNLVTHAWRLWRKGSALELLDPTFREKDPEDRPMMSTIILLLTSITMTLQVPHSPGFFLKSSRDRDSEAEGAHSFGKPVPCSINDASITDLLPR
ncbi:hypothetical protein EUTSA_v10028517mg [Eutrema salsugineum]|uniref:Uncharacterized protein n=1 Tax=Eutrema salsugineum TaxID=72664 RepID=V4L7M8_EUTSA|nr:hypothetical protein EUTSA_v10028517mg [Eutrema salsugineum]